EIDHALLQPAPPGDPLAHVLRIDLHEQRGAAGTTDRRAIVAWIPGGVEAEPGAGRNADPVTRDHAEDHGAGRKTWPVDDHALTRMAQRSELLEIGADLTAVVG